MYFAEDIATTTYFYFERCLLRWNTRHAAKQSDNIVSQRTGRKFWKFARLCGRVSPKALFWHCLSHVLALKVIYYEYVFLWHGKFKAFHMKSDRTFWKPEDMVLGISRSHCLGDVTVSATTKLEMMSCRLQVRKSIGSSGKSVSISVSFTLEWQTKQAFFF